MSQQQIYDPKLFWDERAMSAGSDFEAAVCYDDPTKNKIIDMIQKKLLRKAFRQISQRADLAGKKILDYGCGTGRWVDFFQNYGMEYTGVDLSTEMVRIASERFPYANFSVVNTEEQYPSQTFDIVCSIGVIHHNPYKEQLLILHELSRMIKINGFLILFESISSPDPNNIKEFPRSVAHWKESLEAFGLKQFWIKKTRYFITQAIINRMVGNNRFRFLSNKIGIFLDPFLGSYLPTRWQTRSAMVFQKNLD